MKKLSLLFLLLWVAVAGAQTTGHLVRTNCATITSPMEMGVACLQSTTVGGRTAGHIYVMRLGVWVDIESAASGVPGGSNTQVQFNDSSVFGGDAGLTYNKATDVLTAVGGFVGPLTGNVTGNLTGAVTGNASTATAFPANPNNCSTGEAPLGITAAGVAEGCFDVATQTELNTHDALTGTAAHSATSTNTASRIVTRDASGNFAAGTMTGNVTGNVTGAVTGNASTATALAANGTNCGAGEAAAGVDASGNAEGCASIASSGGVPTVLDLGDNDVNESADIAEIATTGDTNSIFTEPSANKLLIDLTKKWPAATAADLATAATALAANGANCTAGNYPLGVNTLGAVEDCTALPTNVPTATALAANGTNCAAGSFPRGVDASGSSEDCTDAATQTELDAHINDATDAHAGTAITNTPAGGIAATTVQAAINELDTEKQTLDSDLTALAANSTNGIWARTGAGTGSARTIAGTTNQIAVSNGDGVAAAPVISIPTNPTLPGTTTGTFSGNLTGAVTGNASTSTAFAANGTNCGAGQFAAGVDASGNAEGCTSAGAGDVVGPASAVNNRVAFFDGTTGKLIKDSGLLLSGSNTGDQTATTVTNTPAGNIAATTVQAAINELDTEKMEASSTAVVATFDGGACSGYLKSDGSCDDAITAHSLLTGRDTAADSHPALYPLVTDGNGDPAAASGASALAHIYIRNDCTVNGATVPCPFLANNVAGDFFDFGIYAHSWSESTSPDGTSRTASRNTTQLNLTSDGIISTEYAKRSGGSAATNFANQPANDGIEVVSSAAGDTTQTLTLVGTTTGGGVTVFETITLNGTTQVATTKTNWGNLHLAILSATTTGTVTIREASGNATIATISPGDLHAASAYLTWIRPEVKLKEFNFHYTLKTGVALVNGDDRLRIYSYEGAGTLQITAIKGWTDTGTTTFNIQKNDGSAADIASADITASTAGVGTSTFAAGESTLVSGQSWGLDVVTAAASGAPTELHVSITGYVR